MSCVEYETISRFFIYLLVDPRDGAVRYVGCTIDPDTRLSAHESSARVGKESPKDDWIRELHAIGLAPLLRVIGEAATVGAAACLEQEWIVHHLSDEADLFNRKALSTYPGPRTLTIVRREPSPLPQALPVTFPAGNGKPLSSRQEDVLTFIIAFINAEKMAPTLREIGAHFGIRSTNGVNDHLHALVRKGRIEMRAGKARGIRVLDQQAQVPVTHDSTESIQ